MPEFKVLLTKEEYNRARKTKLTDNQICRLGIQTAEEVCGLIPDGKKVLCKICDGVGTKVNLNMYKIDNCQACKGTGFIYER
jgi:hypothetical protein